VRRFFGLEGSTVPRINEGSRDERKATCPLFSVALVSEEALALPKSLRLRQKTTYPWCGVFY